MKFQKWLLQGRTPWELRLLALAWALLLATIVSNLFSLEYRFETIVPFIGLISLVLAYMAGRIEKRRKSQ